MGQTASGVVVYGLVVRDEAGRGSDGTVVCSEGSGEDVGDQDRKESDMTQLQQQETEKVGDGTWVRMIDEGLVRRALMMTEEEKEVEWKAAQLHARLTSWPMVQAKARRLGEEITWEEWVRENDERLLTDWLLGDWEHIVSTPRWHEVRAKVADRPYFHIDPVLMALG